MEKVSITCKLNQDDVTFLDRLAEVTDRDRTYLIKQAVSDFISLQKWQLEEIDKAIAEAERGEFASDEEVRATFHQLRK